MSKPSQQRLDYITWADARDYFAAGGDTAILNETWQMTAVKEILLSVLSWWITDVISYAKNYLAVHFKLDYINSDGDISNYFPENEISKIFPYITFKIKFIIKMLFDKIHH